MMDKSASREVITASCVSFASKTGIIRALKVSISSSSSGYDINVRRRE